MNKELLFKTRIATDLGTFEFEGSQDFVEKQIERIVDVIKSSKLVSTEATEKREFNSDSAPETIRGPRSKKGTRKTSIEQPKILPDLIQSSDKVEDLRRFFQKKSPTDHLSTFAVLTYWLNNTLQLSEVSADEMWTLYKALNIRPPKVLIQVFRDGKSKRGYFGLGSTGKYYLTSVGETFVDHDLPKVKRSGDE